ncbi:unnamed protein product [Spirodela intermedia]|uniref:Uncharacterized protein n=1 Tax=Spirodela intermedia TaxID=51605 RepID=A0A7I8LGU5_SPIIN|nr:unnamed protein product [Spirodela intermedia]
MSKKKAFSGSTMTLKDFHGGSIPSDLPLPSAPGVTPRPLDRGAYERPIGGGWGSPGIGGGGGLGRQDHLRPRPGSAGGGGGGAVRGLEEGAPFLSHIGRNFDEDERKPFDATSAPRRAVPSGDDAVRSTRSVEARAQIHQQTLAPGRPASSPATQASPQAHHSFGGSVSTVVGGSPHLPSSHSQGSGNVNVAPSAWGMKKEETMMQPAATLSGPGAASRFAQASAIEKVTSGRWQSKPGMLNQIPDAEAVPLSETGGGDARFRENDVAAAEGGSQRRYGDRANFDRVYDRVRSPVYSEPKEKSGAVGFSFDGPRPLSAEGRFIGQQLQRKEIAEVSERMKLTSLPPTPKPLEPVDTRASGHKQAYQAPIVNLVPAENVTEALGDSNPSKPSSGVGDGGNLPVERPKLNLLPRSQQVQQSSEYVEKKREKVFGGARPREVVLKERGVDDAALSLVDPPSPLPNNNRSPHPSCLCRVKAEVKVEHPSPTGRQQPAAEAERGESQWSSRWSDGRRSLREGEKAAESRAETESWRRREEPPPPKPAEQAALRFGKAASAVELAQAFSRSVSDAKPAAAAAAAARAQAAPFSRLTEAAAAAPPEIYSGGARRHINGY